MQEIGLAQNAVLMHGECSISWDLFVKAWSNWQQHSQTCCADCVSTLTKYDHSLLHRLNWQMLDLEIMRQPNVSCHSLLRLLQGFRGRKATDARDKDLRYARPRATRLAGESSSRLYVFGHRSLYKLRGQAHPSIRLACAIARSTRP